MQDNKRKGKAVGGNLLTFFSWYRLLVFRVVTISARVTIKTRREIGNEARIFMRTSRVFSERTTLKSVFLTKFICTLCSPNNWHLYFILVDVQGYLLGFCVMWPNTANHEGMLGWEPVPALPAHSCWCCSGLGPKVKETWDFLNICKHIFTVNYWL